ncbi:MAG: transglutaminase domain-containing protein [Pseudomonadota bacterium]
MTLTALLSPALPFFAPGTAGAQTKEPAQKAAEARFEAAVSRFRGIPGRRERAIAVHDFVRDTVAFGWSGDFYAEAPFETLSRARGYSVTKTALFVALCRAVGLGARMRFVDLDARILNGIIDPGTPRVDHAYAEVLLNGWIAVDSFILDRPFFDAAQAQLQAEGREIGYGTRIGASAEWDGRSGAFAQFGPELSESDFGVHDDAAAFHGGTSQSWNRRTPILRLVFPLAVIGANARIEALRRKVG